MESLGDNCRRLCEMVRRLRREEPDFSLLDSISVQATLDSLMSAGISQPRNYGYGDWENYVPSIITRISRNTVSPDKQSTVDNNQNLSISDLDMLNHYIQEGYFIPYPNLPQQALLPHIQHSLSRTLSCFPSFAGRLLPSDDDGNVMLSCNDAGADFIYANAKSSNISDVLAVINAPDFKREFFSSDRAVSYEGNDRPLLTVQVTELIDGFYIGCSVNQAVAHGTSLQNFINTFTEIFRGDENLIPPVIVQLPAPSFSPPSPLLTRQQSNPFLNVAPPHPVNLANPVPEPHQMDAFSWVALAYCFSAGLECNSIFAQVGANPSNVSIRVHLLSWLTTAALCLLIAANAAFARTCPRMAFNMDRVGSVLVLISSLIAATPTIPVYVSVGCAVFMLIVGAHQYCRNQ